MALNETVLTIIKQLKQACDDFDQQTGSLPDKEVADLLVERDDHIDELLQALFIATEI